MKSGDCACIDKNRFIREGRKATEYVILECLEMNIEIVNNYIGNWQAGRIQIQPTTEEKAIKILIGGDLCPTGRVETAIIEGRGADVFRGFKQVTNNQALSIVNLECPLTIHETPILKTGPNLRAHPDCARELKQAGIDVVTLANNHILDMGEQGLFDTLDCCEEAGLKTVGAGKNIEEATKPLIIKIDDRKIAILNFAENEWSIAGPDKAGASPLDLIDNYYKIHEAKQKADLLLVILHGGNEYYPLPSPRMKKTCRYFVDCGANAVICHHTHVSSGLEIYQDAPIIYSTGNLLFDWPEPRPDGWYRGYMVELMIMRGTVNSLCLLPYEQCNSELYIHPMGHDAADKFLKEILQLSDVIADADRLTTKWVGFCSSRRLSYLNMALCLSGIEQRILEKIRIRPWWRINKKQSLTLANLIRCESHRDILIQLLIDQNAAKKCKM